MAEETTNLRVVDEIGNPVDKEGDRLRVVVSCLNWTLYIDTGNHSDLDSPSFQHKKNFHQALKFFFIIIFHPILFSCYALPKRSYFFSFILLIRHLSLLMTQTVRVLHAWEIRDFNKPKIVNSIELLLIVENVITFLFFPLSWYLIQTIYCYHNKVYAIQNVMVQASARKYRVTKHKYKIT
ncbi:uncharacterized protein LOC130713882 [Lotus japonicus]|uniref:uncharacterized protein LOC130713882 n=1 Tax=Lotus japonicus TaxID=34305 RepID=UPI0025890BAE|nr:uncharacterized protein LOC130713882 [Lotus japonicus]